MRFLFAFLVTAATMLGAIEGTVVNKTGGQPQPGVKVTLTKLGEGGMQSGGDATTDAQGKFRIESDAASAHLLQAVWQGVTYNLSLQPGAAANNVELPVYDALPRLSAVEVTQHMILLETNGQELVVNETIVFQNDSQTTWYNAREGTAKVSVPEGVGEIRARVIAPGGMPVERPVTKGKGFVFLDSAVKPGETRFDFSYRVPVTAPVTFSGRLFHDPGPVRLVIPSGITVEGDNIKPLGTEQRIGAAIYGITGESYKLTLTGAGELTSPEQPAPSDDTPRLQSIAPPGYDRAWKWAFGLTLVFLALGFWAQYIKSLKQASTTPAAGGKRKA